MHPIDAMILRGEMPPLPPLDAIHPGAGKSYYWDALDRLQAAGMSWTASGLHEHAVRMAARDMGTALASVRAVTP